jgi:uridine phosphorylase
MTQHLGEVKTTARTAIVTGDPDRVPHLVEAVGAATATWSKRGYVCSEVDVDGLPLLIAGTGIGGPSTAIAVEELAQLGVEQVIRVGTCGSMQSAVHAGELVISSGSVRDDGTSHHYLPASVPAVPDHRLLSSLVATAAAMAVTHHVGITHCKDAYYVERPEGLPLEDQWIARWRVLRSIGVLATEMEAAALFAVATARRLRAAAIFVPVDRSLTTQQVLASLQQATQVAVRGALAADVSAVVAGRGAPCGP